MRILVNDFAGHPFQVQLSRELAHRGHEVLHTYCSDLQTPRGPLKPRPDDPSCLGIHPIRLRETFAKYSAISRWRHEHYLGHELASVAAHYRPDVILSANMPLWAQGVLLKYSRRAGIRFIFWLQDLYGEGISRTLGRRMGVLGRLAGHYFVRLERALLSKSDHVIAITNDFSAYVPQEVVNSGRFSVIENWAPLDDMPVLDAQNGWAISNELTDKRCLVYTGTLGLKHNPELLVQLALGLRELTDVRVIVISEGLGADYLRRRKSELGLGNLILLPFQPFEVMPEVLATAEVLIAILEPDAGVFAVPSKVLTYLCAQRPLLLAVPRENLAARIVLENRAGLVVDPTDGDGFVQAARDLLQDTTWAREMGVNGRQYAERTFDIRRIADRFEAILCG